MKLLLVEDEVKTVDYLRRGLSENGYVVDTATNGVDGLHMACTEPYDAIVLDVMLPDLDGVSMLKSLRREQQTPVIMLTARDDLDDRLNAFDAGADDYLAKPFSFLELLARLNVLTRRGRQSEPSQLTVGDLRIDLLSRRAMRGSRRLDLSAREFTLLSVLARRQSQIVSKTAITELVWDISFDCNTNVVEVAIKRLRAKLDWPGEPKLLHTIRGMGYVLECRAEEVA